MVAYQYVLSICHIRAEVRIDFLFLFRTRRFIAAMAAPKGHSKSVRGPLVENLRSRRQYT